MSTAIVPAVTVLPPEVTTRVVVTVGVGAMSPAVVPVAPAQPRVTVVRNVRRGKRIGEEGIMMGTRTSACLNLRADPL
jgi:hypothetical protein